MHQVGDVTAVKAELTSRLKEEMGVTNRATDRQTVTVIRQVEQTNGNMNPSARQMHPLKTT